MQDEMQKRLGSNEAVFREINEGIERGQWPGEEDAPISFRCECARLGFRRAVVGRSVSVPDGLKVHAVAELGDALGLLVHA